MYGENKITVKIAPCKFLPQKSEVNAAGFDLCFPDNVQIPPGKLVIIPLDHYTEIPDGYFFQLHERSSFSRFTLIMRAGGIIDSSYRGNWKVSLYNYGNETTTLEKGTSGIQATLHKNLDCKWEQTDDLNSTPRGKKGFGEMGGIDQRRALR